MKFLDSVRNFAFPRCAHLSPSGRRCSQPVCSSNPTFCFIHSPKPDDDPAPDQAFQAELAQSAATLDSPADVRRILSKLFVAVLEDRIPLRKARLLNAMSHTLLRAHREIAYHQKLKDQNPYEEQDIFDVPRPIRDDPDPVPPPQLPATQSHNSTSSYAAAHNSASSSSLSSRPEHASCAAEGSWQVQCPTTNPKNQATPQSSSTKKDAAAYAASSVEVLPSEQALNSGTTAANNALSRPQNPSSTKICVAGTAVSSVEPFPSEPACSPTLADPYKIVGTLRMPNSFSATPIAVSETGTFSDPSLEPYSPASAKSEAPQSATRREPPPNLSHLRHFYPWDPTLPPGTQDPWSNIPPEYRPDSPRSRRRFRGSNR